MPLTPEQKAAYRRDGYLVVPDVVDQPTLARLRTLHASSENRLDHERPLLLYSYSAVVAFRVFIEYDIADYDSWILRGAPTRTPRCEGGAHAHPTAAPEPVGFDLRQLGRHVGSEVTWTRAEDRCRIRCA